jgi:hypothetical protein
MFFTDDRPGAIPIHLVYEDRFEEWRAAQNDATRHWISANSFKGERHKIVLLPGPQGRPSAVFAGMGRLGPREELSLQIGRAVRARLGLRSVQVRALPSGKPRASRPAQAACRRATR